MRSNYLRKVTGKELKKHYEWLVREKEGCCFVYFARTEKYRYFVCMGWHHYDDEMVKDEHGNPVTGRYGVKYKPIWKIAWKIGRQTHNNAMQCDFDIDFEMPWNTKAYCDKMNAGLTAKERRRGVRYVEGEVYDTTEIVCLKDGKTTPEGYRDWNALAAHIRKTAREVFAYAKEVEPGEGD